MAVTKQTARNQPKRLPRATMPKAGPGKGKTMPKAPRKGRKDPEYEPPAKKMRVIDRALEIDTDTEEEIEFPELSKDKALRKKQKEHRARVEARSARMAVLRSRFKAFRRGDKGAKWTEKDAREYKELAVGLKSPRPAVAPQPGAPGAEAAGSAPAPGPSQPAPPDPAQPPEPPAGPSTRSKFPQAPRKDLPTGGSSSGSRRSPRKSSTPVRSPPKQQTVPPRRRGTPTSKADKAEKAATTGKQPPPVVPPSRTSGGPLSGPSRTKRRLNPGSRALLEIRHWQKRSNLLISKLPFQRVVREIIQEDHGNKFKFQSAALMALQEASEHYLVRLLEDAGRSAVHAKRVTVMPKDIQFVLTMRAPGHS